MSNILFIANQGREELSDIEKYGTPVYLTEGFVKLNNLPQLRDRLIGKIKHANPDSDLLILNGSALLCCVLFTAWLSVHKRVNILHFEPRYGYRTISLTPTDTISELLAPLELETES